MNGKKPIDLMLQELHKNVQLDRRSLNVLQNQLSSHVRNIYTDSISQHKSWCVTFRIPEKEILKTADMFNIDLSKLQVAFIKQWLVPPDAHMWTSSFYHILILYTMYGLNYKHRELSEFALIILMCRLWNGRRLHYIPYCYPDIMRYVIANLSGQYLAKQYDSPMAVIREYHVPNLLKKYGDRIIRDSTETKTLFSQGFSRLSQMFRSSPITSIKTGQKMARGGLQKLYFAAHESGNKIMTPSTQGYNDDVETSSIEQYTSHRYDDMISSIQDYIVMNINPKYEATFYTFLHRETGAKPEQAKILLTAMHSSKYGDHISDMLQLAFKQLQIGDELEVCSTRFFEHVKKKLISSKHSQNVTQFKRVVDMLLQRIYDDKIKYRSYSDYTAPTQGKLRNIIIFGLARNIQSYICDNKAQR